MHYSAVYGNENHCGEGNKDLGMRNTAEKETNITEECNEGERNDQRHGDYDDRQDWRMQ